MASFSNARSGQGRPKLSRLDPYRMIQPRVTFQALIVRAGTKEGARALFQALIAQLVKVKHPTARQIQANPGDWGLDCIVGSLNDLLFDWQAKFFIDGVEAGQQQEIRSSFQQFVKKAKEEGYSPGGWTLCIPVDMDALTTKWWDGWKKKEEKEHGFQIHLWDATHLEAMLISPDASDVYQAYFGSGVTGPARPELKTVPVPAGMSFDEMLFIKQLRAANVTEVEQAKRQFFNADLMKREVADKAVEAEVQELESCIAEVHTVWELGFNEKCEKNPSGAALPGLYPEVMNDIKKIHLAKPRGHLPMGLLHRLGTMHHVVDGGQAGWVRNFRAVAAAHGKVELDLAGDPK